MKKKFGAVAGIALALAAGAVTLPQNTCVVSGDVTRSRDGVQSVAYSGALDSFWRSRVLEIATAVFRACRPLGLGILFR